MQKGKKEKIVTFPGADKNTMTKDEFYEYCLFKEREEQRKKEWERIKNVIGEGYDEFWHTKKRYRVVKGGRGSKKSTTTALWLTYQIMKHKEANAVVVRKFLNTHKDSTYAQLQWACKQWGTLDDWTFTVNPLEITYKPHGNKIIFRGFDDPYRLTSMTVPKGYLCWCWINKSVQPKPLFIMERPNVKSRIIMREVI